MKRIFTFISMLLVATLLATTLASCSQTSTQEATSQTTDDFSCVFSIAQIDEEQQIEVSWVTEDILTKLEVTVKHGEQTVSQKTFEGDSLTNCNVTVDAYYGKHNVTLKATGAQGQVKEISKNISLSASEYVIAPISGSMPQLYFTLNMNEITNNGSIPAFVWLSRPDSWNWDNLPENVYAMPTVSMDEVLTHDNFDRMVEVTDKYIEELYSINKNSKFNLYINDFNSYLYLKLLVGNGISESNYYVTLLSDGGASYKAFNTAFNSSDENFDADEKYSEMVKNMNDLYVQVKEVGDYYHEEEGKFVVDPDTFRQYSYVSAKEKDNVEWWVLRPRDGVLCSPDKEFITTVLTTDKTEGIIEERNFAKPLTTMNDDEKTALKALYNFNNEMFEAADTQGKKAMMILGSWATAENEPDFEDYANLIKAYYGEEDFVYYYKGHPNTPTSNNPDKAAQLEKLGLIDVESSINAELILFFYPDIYMCGYNSSTFMSVESPEMACTMFNMTLESANANENMTEYKGLIGIYTSKITEDSDYASLCFEEGHNYYLMQFNNEKKDCDFGVYDATANTFTYYNLVDDEFVVAE